MSAHVHFYCLYTITITITITIYPSHTFPSHVSFLAPQNAVKARVPRGVGSTFIFFFSFFSVQALKNVRFAGIAYKGACWGVVFFSFITNDCGVFSTATYLVT